MVGLALLSVAIVVGDIVFRARLVSVEVLGTTLFAVAIGVDLLITLVFLVEFFGSAKRFGSLAGYARANWYEVVGMVPMALFVWLEVVSVPGGNWPTMLATGQPVEGAAASNIAGTAGALRLFRLLRIVRIFVAGSRLVRATNLTFGEQVTKRIFARYQTVIVDTLTTPIVVHALSQAQRTVAKGRYAESVGKALDAKRPEIHALVLKSLERARLHHAMRVPGVDRIVERVEEDVLDAVVDTLTSEQLNKVIQDVIFQVLEDFKAQMASGEMRKTTK